MTAFDKRADHITVALCENTNCMKRELTPIRNDLADAGSVMGRANI
jgi:hypothetical protein